MDVTVYWSEQAKKTFAENIDYLKDAWSDAEVKKFLHRSEYVLLNVEGNPVLYSFSKKNKKVRKAVVNKHITLYYRYFPKKKLVALLTFWNTHQDSRKLKY